MVVKMMDLVLQQKVHGQKLFEEASQNTLKAAYFPVWMVIELDGQVQVAHYNTNWTFGRRTDDGVSKGDACSIDYGRLCDAILKAGKDEQYGPMHVKDHFECYAQVVNPEQTISDRKNTFVGGKKLTDYNRIILGGLPNLDGMRAQNPGEEFDYPHYLKDTIPARIPEKGTNIVWDYFGSAKEEGVDLEKYTWQNMVAGKDRKSTAWNWELLEIFPSGKAKEILRVDEIPHGGADLLHDAVLIYAGKGVDPYNPEVYGIVIVGGRGGSSALGGMIVDKNPSLKEIPGGTDFLKQLYYEIEGRPSKSHGIKFVVDDWLQDGQPVKVGNIQKLVYVR